jgi:hypothetical protein
MNKEFGLEINRPFYIVSKMWMRRVATLAGRKIKLQTLSRKNLGQQFFFDEASKTIKNQQRKDLSLEIQSAGKGYVKLRMATTSARWFQLFYYRNDNLLVNEKGAVISIKDKTDSERQDIEVQPRKNNGLHQQWEVVYAEEMGF